MNLDENYSIKKEGDCVTLYFRKERYDEKKKKKVLMKDQWYFNNVASALKKYANEVIDLSSSVSEALERIGKLEIQIESLKINLQ
jgi:hypothetical protein